MSQLEGQTSEIIIAFTILKGDNTGNNVFWGNGISPHLQIHHHFQTGFDRNDPQRFVMIGSVAVGPNERVFFADTHRNINGKGKP